MHSILRPMHCTDLSSIEVFSWKKPFSNVYRPDRSVYQVVDFYQGFLRCGLPWKYLCVKKQIIIGMLVGWEGWWNTSWLVSSSLWMVYCTLCLISFFVACSLSIINCKVSLSLRRVIQMLFTLLSGLERQDMSSSQGLVMVTSSGGTSGV